MCSVFRGHLKPLLSVPCPMVPKFLCLLFPRKTFLARNLGKQMTKLPRIKEKTNKQKTIPEINSGAYVTSNYSDIHGSQQDMA